VQSWTQRQAALTRIAERQLFFVGGAPRSGTTWLQQMLDCHPNVSCRGEGLLRQHLADPLAAMMGQRRDTLAAKNTALFSHTGGYPLPAPEDSEFLTGTAILLALQQQLDGKDCLAIGEKTPENVFFFPRVKQLFPRAKFIGIARDPRDVLTSAWHFFHRAGATGDAAAAKIAFIRTALPSLNEGARTMLSLVEHNPGDCIVVTYEGLLRARGPILGHLYRFLGVPDQADIVEACVARTSFSAATGGRPPGVEQNGSFFRKGVSGDWTSTLTPAMNAMVLAELGWMFPRFGWQP
jgi:hypothetical protein